MKKLVLLSIACLLFSAQMAFAQNAIRGRVLDDQGEGISGASIRIKGTAKGVNSDNNGGFSIVVADDASLIISAAGYKSTEVDAADGVTVKLVTDKKTISGVVVTALGIKREKAALGYATTTLNSDDLNKGNNTSALGALQGKVAGVNITSSTGSPGGSTRVVMRGEKSFGNNNALIVIDGIPVNNSDRTASSSLTQVDFGNRGNDINPDDVEDVTVLNGAAATALYGSAGAAGAIMYTTKSGKKRGKGRNAEISYTINQTWSDVLKYPTFQNKFGQGDVQALADDRRENFSWGLPFDGQLRPWGQVIAGKQLVKPYSAIENNVQSFFNIAKTTENNLSFKGGDEKSAYFIGLNTMNNTGIVQNNYLNKYSVRFNGTHEFSNKFYSGINLNIITSNARTDQGGQNNGGLWNNLIQTPRDIPVSELSDLNYAFNSFSLSNPAGTNNYGYYGAYTMNPYFITNKFKNTNNYDRLLGQVTTGYHINANMNISNRFGGEVLSERTNYIVPKYDLTPIDPLYDGNNKASNGGFLENVENLQSFNNDLILTYNKDLGSKIGFDGILGYNLTQRTTKFLEVDIDPVTNGLVIEDFYNVSNAKSPVLPTNTTSLLRGMGLYTSITVDYDKTFYLTATGRNDWSSSLTNPIDRVNKSFFYPSISGSWIFTKSINNDKLGNILNFGKLRANWAKVGLATGAYNNNPALFGKTTITGGFGSNTFPFNSTIPGFTLGGSYGAPLLRPESSIQSEIGTDLGFFKDRFTLNFTLYQNRNTLQIITQPIAAASGYTGRTINTGEIKNNGIELAAKVAALKLKNGLKCDIYGTYTKNSGKVVSLGDDTASLLVLGGFSGMNIVAKVGEKFGSFYAVDILRDSVSGRPLIDSASGNPISTTNPKILGSYQPDFMASWGTSVGWKGFNLSVLFDTKQGGIFYSRTKDNLEFVGTSSSSVNADGTRDPFIWANSMYVGTDGKYYNNTISKTDPYTYYTVGNTKPAGQDLIDASYVKLRELSLSYSLPASLLSKTKIGGVNFGVYGTNLWIKTAKSNTFVDPEQNAGGASNEQGFDYIVKPSLRNYGVRLNVTF